MRSDDLGPGLVFFPIVGLLLGGALYWTDLVLTGHLGPGLIGGLECGLLAFLTRGLHLDGLADTADGILSSQPREKALAIMKDSSTGALGAMTLIILILIKTLALGEISASGARQWLIIAPVLARNSLIVLAAFSRYAREGGGLGSHFCGRIAQKALIPASLISLALAWILGGASGAAAWALTLTLGLTSSIWFKNRLGGITGDCLGAHLEVVEATVLVIGTFKA